MSRWAFRLILFSLLSPRMFAVTYYVDSTKSNGNTCLQAQTPATARATIQSVVTNCGLLPDDIVHIVAGTYNETVTGIPNGTVGHPIVFVGEGTLGANTIWRHTGGGHDSLTLGAVYLLNNNYIKFQTIKFDGSDEKATIYGLSNNATGLKGIEIRNCTFSNNGNRGVDLDGTTGIARSIYFNVVNVTGNPNQDHVIDSNLFSANYGISVHMIRTSTSTVSNNEFANLKASQYTVATNNGTYNAEAIHFGTGGSGNIFTANYIHDLVKDGYIPGSGPSCRGGSGTSCQYTPSGIKFDSGTNTNTLSVNIIVNIDAADADTGMGVYLESGVNNNNLLNNIIVNVSNDGIHHGSPATGAETGNVDDGNVIYNAACAGINYSKATSGTVKNNIIYVTASGASAIRDSDITSGITYKNNLYFRTSGTNINGWNTTAGVCAPNVTYSTWIDGSHTSEAGSVNADPKFVTNGTDFHLQATSPAIHAGDLGQDMGAYPLGNPPPSATIAVVYPNGGEDLLVGTSIPITWTTTQTGNCKVEMVRYTGIAREVLSASVPCANQVFPWPATPPGGVSTARFWATSLLDPTITDSSDGDVKIHGNYLKIKP